MKKNDFKITSIAVENKISVYLFIVLIALTGIISYIEVPKELFPDITFPYYSVTTVYPGTSPTDIENLITVPIENKIKKVDGVKHVVAKSMQDVSLIFVEFETKADKNIANQELKDAVDESISDLPTDLEKVPEVKRIDLSEIPILFINLSGDLSLPELKKYAEQLQEQLEEVNTITRVDIAGALDREIQINVDINKLKLNNLTFNQIIAVVSGENKTISCGKINMKDLKRNISIKGDFLNVEDIEELMIRPGIYIKDIAQVVDGFKERESYSRQDMKGKMKDVVTLQVIKKSGTNLIDTVDKIKKHVKKFREGVSDNLKIKITGDQSKFIRNSVSNLTNTIVLGFIIVVLVLMFFMGIENAAFAGSAVPLSMLISFILIPACGFTMNAPVQLALIIALGILVDNSIVIVENIYRHFGNSSLKESKSAIIKRAVSEVAVPILSGTLTTLAPFGVLCFWPGIMGQFIIYLPVTLIICLSSSILVAYTMNPVFALSFMKRAVSSKKNKKKKYNWRKIVIIFALSCLFYLLKIKILGNILILYLLVILLKSFVMEPLIYKFQNKFLPRLKDIYKRVLSSVIVGKRPAFIIMGGFLLLIFSFIVTGIKKPEVALMPKVDPDQIFIYLQMPTGTTLEKTNKVIGLLEESVYQILGKNNKDIDFINSAVALGAGKNIFERTTDSTLGKITVGFVEFKYRKGKYTTREYLEQIRERIIHYPGAQIIVEGKEKGPRAGAPISIEIKGDDLEELAKISNEIYKLIDKKRIGGIEELKSDLDINNPEVVIEIDRRKARQLGISTLQIGHTLRTALYGLEVSKFREGEDEYPIQLRLAKEYRDNIQTLMNQEIVVGLKGKIPISAAAKPILSSSYGGIVRKDYHRTVNLTSNVLAGYNANKIVNKLKKVFKSDLKLKKGYSIEFSGEQETKKEMMDFLLKALFVSFSLIFIILVTQFNSMIKPIIIFSQVLLSFIGILLGICIFDFTVSIMMTGMGIIAVAGIVVNNGILLIDYIDLLLAKGNSLKEAIIEGGKTRLVPVLLTAISTVLGLVPLAIGMNINFWSLILEMNPNIYWGGDSAQFWGPLAWTIIFGLVVATFLTLFVVPSMYYLVQKKIMKKKSVV